MSKNHITNARKGELLREVFRILIARPEGILYRDALDHLRSRLELTEHEDSEYDSGRNRFDTTMQWSTTVLRAAGWMRSVREQGTTRWVITEAGRAAFTEYTDPELFFREALARKSSRTSKTD